MGFILAVVSLFWLYSVSKRVEVLERRSVDRTTSPEIGERAMTGVERAARSAEQNALMGTPYRTEVTPVSHAPELPSEPEIDPFSRFMAWVRVDFMMKLGAFLILCALGWFVSYAFMNGWIGPMGRITLGLLTGTAFLVWGYARTRTHLHQGGIITVLGSSAIVLTVYAAREVYGFFTPFSALFMMFLAVAFVAFMSVRYESRSLALASLLTASVLPFFTADPYPDLVERFAYFLVIVLGSLWVVYLRGWSSVTLGALIVVMLHTIPYLNPYLKGNEADMALMFTFIFVAIFFVANILGLIANENDENRVPHLVVAFLTAVYLMIGIGVGADPEWHSLLYVAWMLVFSLGSFVVYRTIMRPEAFYIYGGTSIALLGAATASELSGPALTIAYTLEVTVLVLTAALVLGRAHVAAGLSSLFLVPVALSLESVFSSSWSMGIFHSDFFVLAVLMFSLAICGVALHEGRDHVHDDAVDMGTLLLVISGVYGIVFIWLVLHAGRFLDEDTATLITLVLYTVLGLSFIREWTSTGVRAWKIAGGALIALVVARLLLIEVWNMPLTGRIITFFVIGMLLLSTAFMKKRIDSGAHPQ